MLQIKNILERLLQRIIIKFTNIMLAYTSRNIETEIQMNALRETAKYVEEKMRGVTSFNQQFSLMKSALSQAKPDGLFMEFGVWQGRTINFIAENIEKPVHGFDSFEGLPEFWLDSTIGRFDKGTFNTKGKLPRVRKNVQLHVGWFDKSLPEFVETHKESASFIHIDCDLYSSTKTILNILGERMRANTIILFDEYFNYPGWQNHEFKAFQEFVEQKNIRYKYIGYNKVGREVAVMIL